MDFIVQTPLIIAKCLFYIKSASFESAHHTLAYSGSNLYCCMITFAGVTQQNYSDLIEPYFLCRHAKFFGGVFGHTF